MGIYKVKDRRGRRRYVVSKYWPNGSGRLRMYAPNYRSAQALQTRIEGDSALEVRHRISGRVGSLPEYTLRLRQHPDRDEMGESRQAAAPGRREGGIEGRVTSTHGKRSHCHFRILPLLAAMRKCRNVAVENVKRRGVGAWRSGDAGPVTPTKGSGHPFRPGGKNGGKSVTVKFVSLLW